MLNCGEVDGGLGLGRNDILGTMHQRDDHSAKPMSMANCRLPAGERFADEDGGEPAAAVNVKNSAPSPIGVAELTTFNGSRFTSHIARQEGRCRLQSCDMSTCFATVLAVEGALPS
jgi:hypothetical protein